MKKDKVYDFYFNLQRENPNPKGELYYVNNYTLLIAVVLSAQSTDIGVNKATKPLFKKVKTPKKMIEFGETKLRDAIKTIGLFNGKAKNIIALSNILINDFDGDIPQDRKNLEKLPGVGRKTANVVLNIAFNQPTIAVDTHLFRLGNRTGIAKGKTPLEVEKKLERVTPSKFARHAHTWLILLGRYVCKARKPECYKCVVKDQCGFKLKTLTGPPKFE
ncbi:MAG: endonuclease III [Rhodospirillaceae bacterium]|nr:endonuclease III [Rhodospirillaceae bacterium]OUT77380.1 MAG: endonuclease III [Rhodospirillaceae bacterium TMED23]|tara:strand:- start:331 stop:984 length:654 start_codon:yes stop_codon:yes gene_type:complete